MKVDLAAVVRGWDKQLGTADHLLSKLSQVSGSVGAPEAEILEWRLAPDMFPLRTQVQFVCNLTNQWAAHAAGIDAPEAAQGDGGVEELRGFVAGARRFVSSLQDAQFAGRDDVTLSVDLGVVKPTMPIGQWVTGFATTNILFHLSMAYAILRSRGVELGKADLFAGGL